MLEGMNTRERCSFCSVPSGSFTVYSSVIGVPGGAGGDEPIALHPPVADAAGIGGGPHVHPGAGPVGRLRLIM